MTPQSFDPKTCAEICGDARMRVIEAKARSDAEIDAWAPPKSDDGTYWDGVRASAETIVYLQAFNRRKARIERKKETPTPKGEG